MPTLSAPRSGTHVVAVLTDRVSDDDLAHLRERGASYLFAGARSGDGADREGGGDVDLATASGRLFVGMAFGAALGSLLFAQWGWLAVTALASSTAAGALIVRRWPATRRSPRT